MANIRSDDSYIYIDSEYAEAYIPESFFSSNADKRGEETAAIAAEYGDGFQVIGIFNIRFFDSENQDRESVPTYSYIYPNTIETYPTDALVGKVLTVDGVTDKYRVLQYQKGDILSNIETKKSVTNCEKFVNLLTTGKIPRALAYDDILGAWVTNFDINGISPSVPSVVLQAIISEICRVRENPSISFRFEAGKGNADMNAYRGVNMSEISGFSSVFSALSFERFNEKLVTALNMSYSNAKQERSPVEQVITM